MFNDKPKCWSASIPLNSRVWRRTKISVWLSFIVRSFFCSASCVSVSPVRSAMGFRAPFASHSFGFITQCDYHSSSLFITNSWKRGNNRPKIYIYIYIQYSKDEITNKRTNWFWVINASVSNAAVHAFCSSTILLSRVFLILAFFFVLLFWFVFFVGFWWSVCVCW